MKSTLYSLKCLLFAIASCLTSQLANGQPFDLQFTLDDPTSHPGDEFGASLAVDGNTVLIGAWADETFGDNVGQAHLFNGTTGALLRTFNDPHPTEKDAFGLGIAIDGGRALIGEYGDDTNGQNAGRAHLFDTTSGELIRSFDAPTPSNKWFGVAVDLEGNSALVSGGETTVLFDVTTGDVLQTFSDPSNADSGFGASIALAGDRIVIGAINDDTNGMNVGRAYLFDATSGDLLHTFDDPTPTSNDHFGCSVALDADSVLIGAYYDETNGRDVGQAHLFDATTGSLLRTFDDPTPTVGDVFGIHVALDEGLALIGATGHHESQHRTGEAHLFEVSTGELVQTLTYPGPAPADPTNGAQYGSVAMDNGTIAIGGRFISNDDGLKTGRAYIYSTATVPEPPAALLMAGIVIGGAVLYRRRS
ncbi:hypothetical protein NG895_18700 [Aeoliella sp. ICT_H6.2]|uniref:PEP-CTERM protein-sorting domain-containing protein n=1 Tax=Aeoliella straminimaris TaxID=2954799 RepID=A0A9X2FGE8_9BACT|nr:hypothetical protein [Aeoliella straminimaris]MCO6045934.1 hypothetical protein [Aeoliella straminimaris]